MFNLQRAVRVFIVLTVISGQAWVAFADTWELVAIKKDGRKCFLDTDSMHKNPDGSVTVVEKLMWNDAEREDMAKNCPPGDNPALYRQTAYELCTTKYNTDQTYSILSIRYCDEKGRTVSELKVKTNRSVVEQGDLSHAYYDHIFHREP